MGHYAFQFSLYFSFHKQYEGRRATIGNGLLQKLMKRMVMSKGNRRGATLYVTFFLLQIPVKCKTTTNWTKVGSNTTERLFTLKSTQTSPNRNPCCAAYCGCHMGLQESPKTRMESFKSTDYIPVSGLPQRDQRLG